MMQQSIRVLLASEYPETRSFLKRIVEAEDKAVIVGEAENGTKALTLARNLRPDVAIIDSYLPHVVGLDGIPLSRVGGLDAAQSINEEIPNIRVVLLNSLANTVISDSQWRPDVDTFLCQEGKEACIPFTIGELHQRAEFPGTLVFANVEADTKTANPTITGLSDKGVFFGALSMFLGWCLIITMFLANIGVYLAIAGAVTLTAGLTGKLILKTWRQR